MSDKRPPARMLVAPVVLALFAIAWYEFSVVYIDGANQEVFSKGDFAVYVSMTQVQAYLYTTTVMCYIIVFIALLIFGYQAVRYARYMRSTEVRARSESELKPPAASYSRSQIHGDKERRHEPRSRQNAGDEQD